MWYDCLKRSGFTIESELIIIWFIQGKLEEGYIIKIYNQVLLYPTCLLLYKAFLEINQMYGLPL